MGESTYRCHLCLQGGGDWSGPDGSIAEAGDGSVGVCGGGAGGEGDWRWASECGILLGRV